MQDRSLTKSHSLSIKKQKTVLVEKLSPKSISSSMDDLKVAIKNTSVEFFKSKEMSPLIHGPSKSMDRANFKLGIRDLVSN